MTSLNGVLSYDVIRWRLVLPFFDDSVEDAVTILDHRRTGPGDGGETAEACREPEVGFAAAKKSKLINKKFVRDLD